MFEVNNEERRKSVRGISTSWLVSLSLFRMFEVENEERRNSVRGSSTSTQHLNPSKGVCEREREGDIERESEEERKREREGES